MADVFNRVNWFKPCTHTLRMKPRNIESSSKITGAVNSSGGYSAGIRQIEVDGFDSTVSKKVKAVLDMPNSVYCMFGTASETVSNATKRQIYRIDKAEYTADAITKIFITPELQTDLADDDEIEIISTATDDWDAYLDAGVIGDSGTPIQQNLENTEIQDERLAVFEQENRVTGFTFTPTLLQLTIPTILLLVPGSQSVHNNAKSAVKFKIGNFNADKWGLQMVPKDNPEDTSRYVTCVNGTATIDGGAALNIGGNDETKSIQMTFKSDTDLTFGDPDATFENAPTYTVTFDINTEESGAPSAPAAQSVISGDKATKPTDPTMTGWTFGGWYNEAACTTAFSFTTAITADKTLYAKWTED